MASRQQRQELSDLGVTARRRRLLASRRAIPAVLLVQAPRGPLPMLSIHCPYSRRRAQNR
jgi:hypothetical protein